MTTIISTGPGERNRKTKVSRMPFWKPDEKEWVFLPVDRAHNQQVVEEDREGNSLGSVNLYESKGWQPLRFAQANAEAMKSLPTNWRDVAHNNATPVFEDAEEAKPATKAEAKKGDGGDTF